MLLENIYEALEKALYLYEEGYLPLIGETSNPAVTIVAAKQYQADALICDETSWLKFQKELQKLSLKSVTVLKS